MAMLAACPNLEELDMSSCPAAASDALLSAVGHCCRSLGSLYLEEAGGGHQFGDEAGPSAVSLCAVANLVKRSPKLQVGKC